MALNCDFCGAVDGSKDGKRHRIGAKTATMRDVGAAAAQWRIAASTGEIGAASGAQGCCRNTRCMG